MATYNIISSSISVSTVPATLFKVGFGEPAQNDQIVKDADQCLADLGIEGGKIALVNGPASLPVAVVIAHRLVHLYGVVGIFDPKLAAYVVAASHDPDYPLGSLIPATDVVAA